MLRSLISRLFQEASPRPRLGRWCHVEYDALCDPMKKAEWNTNDHGVVLVHAPPREKSEKKDTTPSDGPWDHPTMVTIVSGFGM